MVSAKKNGGISNTGLSPVKPIPLSQAILLNITF